MAPVGVRVELALVPRIAARRQRACEARHPTRVLVLGQRPLPRWSLQQVAIPASAIQTSQVRKHKSHGKV
eukprot:COSAG05_NODE_147_length_16383_cov_266.102555_23_plen_70_part_00